MIDQKPAELNPKVAVRSQLLEVPDDAPFKYDLLGREPIAVAWTNVIGSLSGSAVLAINGDWVRVKRPFCEFGLNI